MPKWVIAQAAGLGLSLDSEAARALIAIVGSGQQRLAREIEKLAIAVHPETAAGAEDVERVAGGDTIPKVYDLADAVTAGDVEATLTLAEELAARDERPGRLVYPVVNRLREVHGVIELLESGVAEKDLAGAAQGAAVASEEGAGACSPDRPRDAWSAPSAASPTWRSSCAAAARWTRTRPSPWRWRAPPPEPGHPPYGYHHSFGRDLGLDVHVLGLLEGLQPLLAQLAAQARLLEAAERARRRCRSAGR